MEMEGNNSNYQCKLLTKISSIMCLLVEVNTTFLIFEGLSAK